MALQFDKPAQSHAETPRGVVVVRGHENSLAGWAATKSCDTAPATVVDGSQTSHSLQLAVKTEMRTLLPLIECLLFRVTPFVKEQAKISPPAELSLRSDEASHLKQ